MKLSELLKGVEILENNVRQDFEISEIVYDSRKATADSVFVAIVGSGTDGHSYIESAFNKGAVCCVVENKGIKNSVVVKDSRLALNIMASNFYNNPASSLKLIGITGTNGKTTSTYLIKQVLESLGHKVGLIGTIQNMIGKRVIATHYTTPEPTELQKLFAMMRDEDVSYAVMEVSAHSLVQHRVTGLQFEVGVFTNLTQDHLDYFETMDNYLAAKAKLFDASKIGVFNADDSYYEKIVQGKSCDKVTYSLTSDSADIVAKNVQYKPDGIQFEVVANGKIGTAKLNIPGKFSVYNALAVIATCLNLGIELEKIIEALKTVSGVKGRVEVVPTGKDFTAIIDYAHSPDSLYNVLQTLKSVSKGRIVTLFGCGGDRDKTKRPIMGKIAFDMSDFCIVTSDNPRTEEPMDIINDIMAGVKQSKTPYKIIENRKEAIEFAVKNAQKDDIILLAGKGHETYQILKDKTIHFDEREVIAEILK